MSKKASADQFSVSGGNLGQNPQRKTVFFVREGLFLGGSSYSSDRVMMILFYDFISLKSRHDLFGSGSLSSGGK